MDEFKVRGQQFFSNKMQKEIFFFIFCACLGMSIIAALLIHYLIFNMGTQHYGVPSAILYNVFPTVRKATMIIAVIVPLFMLFTLFFACKITQRMVGPFNRVIRELDEIIKGKRRELITVRKNDSFQPLIDRINVLIEKSREI